MNEGATATPYDNSTMPDVTVTPEVIIDDSFCKWILYKEIEESGIRIWDLAILVPNALFALVLALRFNRARLKLRATCSPIFLAFYCLVVVNTVMSIIRCIVSMTVNAAVSVGEYTDRVLWILLRFVLLFTELSVLFFGLMCGHWDSGTSIRRVLAVTSFVSLVYSGTQGALEVSSPDDLFYVDTKKYHVFGHGGMLFWCVSSAVFFMIYTVILILPWTRLRERLALPTKRPFYYYCGFMASLYLVMATGCALILYNFSEGLCAVNLCSYLYFIVFTPLVYHTFLSEFFGISQPSILFSYKAQVDEVMEDDVSLPHQQSFSSLKTDSDYIFQNAGMYDSTHLDAGSPTAVNPLYAASLHSPDSITGYSVNSYQGST